MMLWKRVCRSGAALTALAACAVAETVVLNPVADAYVQGESFSDRNFGEERALLCKSSPDNERFAREPYLRFDLAALVGPVTEATLRLKVASADGSGDAHAVHLVGDDSWGETTITWNNRPGAGALLASAFLPAVGAWLEADATSQVAAEAAGDGMLSVAVRSDGSSLAGYHARESSAASRPQLVVTTPATPILQHPADGGTEHLTLPYFEWDDVVAHPYPGRYEIQIDDADDFASPLDEDEIPALLSWYSPTEELLRGATYYWRVRYVDPAGTAGAWSAVWSFTVGYPYVVDVAVRDGWDDIQAKYAQAADFGDAYGAAGELRFPPNHTFHLVQDPADDYLLDYPGKDNVIINGRGSTLVLRHTQPGPPPIRCGFLYLRDQNHIQVKDITIDYAPESLSQFGGVISALDEPNRTFTVTIDPNAYANFAEAAEVSSGYFVDAEHLKNIALKGVHWEMENTWAEGQQSATVFHFTADVSTWGRIVDVLEDGDYFISSPVPDRGGDVIMAFDNVTDLVAHDVTTLACRGRFFAIGRANCEHVRCVNNDFLRSQGRLRGSASGGVNHQGDYAWYENCRFEHTRDDAFHAGGSGSIPDGPGQVVVRGCTVTSAFRNSIWVQHDRTWVAKNTVMHAGGPALHIGETATSNPINMQMDVGLIEDNLVVEPHRFAFEADAVDSLPGDPGTGLYNQYLTIRNNTIRAHDMDAAFELSYVRNSTFQHNTAENSAGVPWSPYSDPAAEVGVLVQNSENVAGVGNVISDPRIAPADRLVIGPACTNIALQVSGCVGDVDGDGQTDAADCDQATAMLGTADPAADLDRDGVVDLRDIAICQTDCGCQ